MRAVKGDSFMRAVKGESLMKAVKEDNLMKVIISKSEYPNYFQVWNMRITMLIMCF